MQLLSPRASKKRVCVCVSVHVPFEYFPSLVLLLSAVVLLVWMEFDSCRYRIEHILKNVLVFLWLKNAVLSDMASGKHSGSMDSGSRV